MMPNRCFLSVRSLAGLKALPASDPQLAAALLIDRHCPADVHELLSGCFDQSPQTPLTLAFVRPAPPEEWLASIVSLFLAHPAHLRSEEGLYFFVPDQDSAHQWTAWMQGQGYRHLMPQVGMLGDEGLFQLSDGMVNRIGETAGSFYPGYLSSRYRPTDGFLIHAPEEARQRALYREWKEGLSGFAAIQPYLFQLIGEQQGLHRQQLRMERLAEATAEELAIVKELLRINKETNEVAYILDFYKKEYEVLPLWYKRLGHVIKAVMGKRSWRSLIKDDEKG